MTIMNEKLNMTKVIAIFFLEIFLNPMRIFCLDAPSALLSHADICKLRYQTTGFTALHGLNQLMTPPGMVLYNSSK